MKLLLQISILLFSIQSFAQIEENVKEFNELRIDKKREVLINELLNDTIKYSKEDTYHTVIGTLNKNSYSQLFIINGKQYFKFDIVNGDCVVEFIDEYLDKVNLKSIKKLDKKVSLGLYGTNGENGVTIINLKNLKKAKTKNCGFVESKKGAGSNLDQWKKGEIRIRSSGVTVKKGKTVK